MPSKHTISMRAGWRLWRCAPLRGTGFPTTTILNLAAPEASEAAKALFVAEVARREACQAALEATRAQSRSGSVDRGVARKAMAKFKKGAACSDPTALGSAATSAHAANAAVENAVSAEKAFARCYEQDSEKLAQNLAHCAQDPRFVEAMLWQNPEAAKLVLPKVRDLSHKRNRGLRQAQGLVANYLQRYCVKNDTIGFFGPVGWATLDEEDRVEVVPGPTLLRRRAVYFEHWALMRLAEHFSQSEDVRMHVAPRLLPSVRVEGTTVHYRVDKSTRVPPHVAELLQCATGEVSAQALSEALCRAETNDIEDPDEVVQMLEELGEMGLITWTIEVPSGGPNAAAALRKQLADLPASAAAESALASFDSLDAARAHVESCAGDPEALSETLRDLAAQFTELVGQPATRNAGQMYAGRTMVYEDCLRDVSASLGRPFVEAFAPALHLMAMSAQWFSYEIASQYRALADTVFDELEPSKDGTVPYVALWKVLAPTFPKSTDDASSIAKQVRERLTQAWGELFGLEAAKGDVIKLRSSDLLSRAEALFASPFPGWPSARHVSPDMMLAASPDAFAAGDFVGVLGEIHLGNSVPSTVRLQQHDAPMDVFTWNDDDLQTTVVCPVQPGELVTRADRVSWSATDVSLELGKTRSWREREDVLRVADLRVRRTDGRLQVETRDGSRVFDIIAFLDPYLTFTTTSNFSWAPSQQYVPRVMIDDLVVLRQQWKYSNPQQFDFVSLNEGPEQFLACKRWAQEQGLPRWVFYKVPEETKPIFLDFDSPVLVAKARNILHKASRVSFSEMSPSFDELWLTDAEKNTYTSELRIVAVAPDAWRPESSSMRSE